MGTHLLATDITIISGKKSASDIKVNVLNRRRLRGFHSACNRSSLLTRTHCTLYSVLCTLYTVNVFKMFCKYNRIFL